MAIFQLSNALKRMRQAFHFLTMHQNDNALFSMPSEAVTEDLATGSQVIDARQPLIEGRDSAFSGSRTRPPAKRAFLHDLMLTMGAEAGAVVSGLLLTSIVSREMGSRALAEYLLLRRVLTWTLAATMVGLTTGLPRYVAFSTASSEEDEHGYFLAASACLIVAATFAGGILILARHYFAQCFFGNSQEDTLVVALACLLFGYAIHRIIGGYYRGLLEMMRANLLDILNLALLPIVILLALFRQWHIGAIMAAIGILMAFIASLFAIPLLCRLQWRAAAHRLGTHCRELLRYGLPRIPGEFGAATGMALGPILAVHYMSITDAAPLLLGLSMLMLVGYAAGPLASMLLSKVSMMLGQNQLEEVQTRMMLLITAIMEIAAFACFQLLVFADVVVRAWVGPGFDKQMDVIRLVLLAIPPYLLFVSLRNTIDAASVKPFNTANVLISLALYIVLIFACIALFPIHALLTGIAGSLLVAQILLAILTTRTFRRLYGVRLPWLNLMPSFIAASVLGAAALAFRMMTRHAVPIFEAVLVEMALTALYLALLAKRRSNWVVYAWNVGVCRRANWSPNTLRP